MWFVLRHLPRKQGMGQIIWYMKFYFVYNVYPSLYSAVYIVQIMTSHIDYEKREASVHQEWILHCKWWSPFPTEENDNYYPAPAYFNILFRAQCITSCLSMSSVRHHNKK